MSNPKRTWEQPWQARPFEEASNLNPAFCGELIVRTVEAYTKARGSGLPLALAFLIVPLILHPKTRAVLPRSVSSVLGNWVSQQNANLAEFPERAARLSPVTREALLFALQCNALAIDSSNIEIGSHPIRTTKTIANTTSETTEMRSKAALLGRWFANYETHIIMQTFGVKP